MRRLRERSGKVINNFKATLPPSGSDLARQSFKDPYFFDFVSMTGKRNEREPIGIAEWESEIVKSMPEEFISTLPSISELEAELSQDISSEDPVNQGESP